MMTSQLQCVGGMRMQKEPKGVEAALETVDAAKRSTLRRMATMAFVTPVVASFALDGMALADSLVADSNNTVTHS
jgi:hypothetical protein